MTYYVDYNNTIHDSKLNIGQYYLYNDLKIDMILKYMQQLKVLRFRYALTFIDMRYFVYCKVTYPNVDDFEVTAGFIVFGVDDGIVDE